MMKKLLLSLALLLAPVAAAAQCNGVFAANTICGNPTGSPAIPGQVPQSSLTGVPGGSPGQIEYNNAGNFGGFTATGDATIVPSTGVVTVTKTNSVAFAPSATTDATNAANISSGTLSISRLVAGILHNTLSTQTLPFTITNANVPCGSLINIAGGPGTLTLNAIAGFPTTCTFKICNTALNTISNHAVTLSGFPVPTYPHLWMGLCMGVTIVNGAWVQTDPPGKFVPAFTYSCFVDTTGSNTNDGLVNNATTAAVRDPQQCLNLWNTEVDLGGQQPLIVGTVGQTNQQNGGAGALTLIGGTPKVVFVQGNGANWTLQSTTTNFVTQVQDFGGYFIFTNITLDCTGAASHPCYDIFGHQQGGVDLNANTILKGANAADIGINGDSFFRVNGNALVTVGGTMNNVFVGNSNSAYQFSNGITTQASSVLGGDLILANGNTSISYSGPLTLGAGTTLPEIFGVRGESSMCLSMGTVTGTFTSTRQWSVLGNSVLSNQSATAVPGTAGITTATGFAPGFIGGATSGGC